MKKNAVKRKRTDPRLALRIARAQLRAIRQYATGERAEQAERAANPLLIMGPMDRFVQCWACTRGYSAVTQALDAQGQVWERVSLMDEKEQDGKKVKYLRESYWVPLDMTRKKEGE